MFKNLFSKKKKSTSSHAHFLNTHSSKTTTKDVLKQVKSIELSTKDLVDGLISGNYHSIFKGQGIEFSEIREYKFGDDIRSIDWKVTARFDHPFIKEFIEERDLRVYFVFDMSASSSFGNTIEKKRKAIDLIATLMFSAMKNNDSVGLFMSTNGIEKYIPARKGKKHILSTLSTIISYKPKEKQTNLKKTLTQVGNILKRKSIVFVISDFFDKDFIKPLSILKNHHDVIAIKVTDFREQDIPNIGLINLEDEETGEQIVVDTSDEAFRKTYAHMMKKESDNLSKIFKKYAIDSMTLYTDESYELSLIKFFKTRLRRSIH